MNNFKFTHKLDKDYPTTHITHAKFFNIKYIKYNPYNIDTFNKCIDIIYKYAISSSVRELSNSENVELNNMIELLESGSLTYPKKNVFLNNNTKLNLIGNTIFSENKKIRFSNKYKKLHWGQRKLLLSEIDFFNMVSKIILQKLKLSKTLDKDLSIIKYNDIKYNIIYPGASRGDKLIYQLTIFPNIKLYLWDPAKFNIILTIADLLRRGINVKDFKGMGLIYNKNQIKLSRKYKDRVFINPELDNIKYCKYIINSIHDISKNYDNKYGIFNDKSIKYCNSIYTDREHVNLFISDIRMFTNTKAIDCIKYNYIKKYNIRRDFLIANEIILNKNYERDMDLQKKWFNLLNCEYGLLKFKLPKNAYNNNKFYKYIDGNIILQPWAPIDSTECRLFITKFNSDKQYEINLHENQMKYFNNIMRLSNFKDILLSDFIDISKNINKNTTLYDIWKYYLPNDKISIDSIIETKIIYDYLILIKGKDNINIQDIILIISDITQILINKTDYSDIMLYTKSVKKLEYLDTFNKIIKKRRKYHDKFNKKLDYNSYRYDNNFCEIK